MRRDRHLALMGAAVFLALVLLALPASASDVRSVIDDFASLGDRSLGSPGCAEAADEIQARFTELAHRSWPQAVVGRQSFLTPIVAHGGSTLEIVGRGPAVDILPARLNALAPGTIAPSGLEGPLLYAGPGELSDFNGREVAGSIVLMDLDSGKNWVNAAMLGAKALIYVDDGAQAENGERRLYTDKFELTPLDFPRFWMDKARAEQLFGDLAGLNSEPFTTVRLNSDMAWKNVRGDNVYCFIPGSDPALADELLVVEAFYDSTAYVPGNSPGADEAASLAGLLATAHNLAENPPGRSTLLLATSGHAQGLAGMREFVWILSSDDDTLKDLHAGLKERVDKASRSIALLSEGIRMFEQEGADPDDTMLVRAALELIAKNRMDDLSTRLMRLRLAQGSGKKTPEIKELEDRRHALRRLVWISSGREVDSLAKESEIPLLTKLVPEALVYQGEVLKDSSDQLAALESGLALKELLKGKTITASVSLHLSGSGQGLGAFERGWLYELYDTVNRTRFFSPLSDLFAETVDSLPPDLADELGPNYYKDTLRPSLTRPWQGYLPDKPALGGEAMAIAGYPGLTLATVHDARTSWGAPSDRPEYVDFASLEKQQALLDRLLDALARKPLDDPGKAPKDRFTTLTGRTNLLRQGELFPDRPAQGTVYLVFQGPARFYAMVDTLGLYRCSGLASRKETIHKAILEGFKFDPATGRAVWAVDKPLTGKAAYRVKMKSKVVERDLVMFSCGQTTLFNLLEPRTFRHLTFPELIDGSTEAEPRRYWYSRLDTGSSSMTTVFLEPGAPLKMTFSDTVIDKKMILLNGSEDRPLGKGYSDKDWPVVPATEYQAAADMWNLLLPRIRNLENRGISNDRLRSLKDRGLKAMHQAETEKNNLRWDRFMDESRLALSIASQVYGEIEKTQKDVLAGVLFYIALFVPFAYCMERLLFNFANIHKRIVAFAGILAAIITVIYFVHPAFELTYSPMVVVLAFFIIGLSVLVSIIIFSRFEREMKDLQRRSRHMRISSISRTSAMAAAFAIGVSNLRRRPLRTLLTCLTLTILTFTIMNFTAVKSVRQAGWNRFGDSASYQGMLMKHLNWETLPQEALAATQDMIRGRGVVGPRVWYETTDKTRAPVISVYRDGVEAQARGMVGLSSDEPQVSGLDDILAKGRWFGADERYAVLLPERIAKQLGVDPSDPARNTVAIWGMDFTVTGLLRDNGLAKAVDLDGEPVTPIIYPSEASTQVSQVEAESVGRGEDVLSYESRYEHIASYETIVIPHATLLSLGGKLKSMAVKPDKEYEDTLAEDMGKRFGLILFKGDKDGSSIYYASNTLSYSGVPNILIPLAISVLIVLNTMIGSVFERRREIGVYTSVGLAPSHVSFLFVAESIALALISTVAGYLLAQGAAALLSHTSIWAGMTANYSSLAGVAAMALVIAVVLLSVIYPSRVAANIAIPDVNRSWTMPAIQGNELDLTLPFLVKVEEQLCAGGFLFEYYDAHRDVSHGLFSTDHLSCGAVPPGEVAGSEFMAGEWAKLLARSGANSCLSLGLRVWLAPFDFGVRQWVRLIFCPSETYAGFTVIKVVIRREAGEQVIWRNLNKGFLNDLRKQLLVWRSLDPEARDEFEARMKEQLPEDARAGMGAVSETNKAGEGHE